MTQRSAVRGKDIRPDGLPYSNGILNAEKCIAYLRGIGVEIDDATADAWLDMQGVARFLKSEKETKCEGQLWHCRCGAMEGTSEVQFPMRRRKRRSGAPQEMPRCEKCGTSWAMMRLVYVVNRDGSTRDYRPMDERWKPLADVIAAFRAHDEGGHVDGQV